MKSAVKTVAFAVAMSVVISACGDSASGPSESQPSGPSENIVEVAQGAGVFGTLLAAVDAAGLTEALSETSPLTVFAPTDEAFAKLPEGTVESLLEPENLDTLTSILTYHVIGAKLYAEDAIAAGVAETLNGQEVVITQTSDGNVTVNEAVVIQADVGAANGVIHVIDTVLLPE